MDPSSDFINIKDTEYLSQTGNEIQGYILNYEQASKKKKIDGMTTNVRYFSN